MDFRLDADQQMIRDAADIFLAEKATPPRCAAPSASPTAMTRHCGTPCASSWAGAAWPFRIVLGGMGMRQVERALLMEQLGRRLACVPYLASACLAVDALLHVAAPAARQRFLPLLADGTLSAALALPAPAGWDADACAITASRSGDGYRIRGTAAQVLGACEAGLLLVPARLAAAAWRLRPVRGRSACRRRAHHGARDDRPDAPHRQRRTARGRAAARRPASTQATRRRSRPGMAATVSLATLALAAEQIGGAWQCLDLTLAYIAGRSQFGRTIASFQAVKHRCAQMMVALEAARSAVYGAVRAAGQAGADLALEAACAKSAANAAFFFCAQEAIQLHGGVGFTWEYDPQLYFKRAQASRTWLGDDACCDALIACAPGRAGAGRAAGARRQRRRALARRSGAMDGRAPGGKIRALAPPRRTGRRRRLRAERKQWEGELAEAGWTCVGWPRSAGGRALPLGQQVIFHEEYARAGGPGRPGHIGEGLIGPTLIAYGSEDQKARFLPGIRNGTTFWCQGYSEPNAGSDLANVQTRAVQDPASGDWIVHGQKVWTSLAHESDWIFVLARCEAGSRGNRGLIFLLMPLHQAGVEIRPIRQISGSAEFNEVFFDGARASAADVVGAPGDGWKIAMALLGFERGMSTLGQQMHFRHELDMVAAAARDSGALRDGAILRRLGQAYRGLRTMRYNSLRMLSGADDGQLGNAGLIYKYYWSNWHRALGELAIDVLGADANLVAPGDATPHAPARLVPVQPGRYNLCRHQ